MYKLDESVQINSNLNIKGYIASVEKPSHLKIIGTDEKATIDLFVNGRLREKDIIRHIPSARIPESYLYGQIHFDRLDQDNKRDVFTSNREGVIAGDEDFKLLLNELKEILKNIINQWDVLRRKHASDGDSENVSIPKKERKAEEMFNISLKELTGKTIKSNNTRIIGNWSRQLAKESHFNIPAYTDCFIIENLLRNYIIETNEPIIEELSKSAEKYIKSSNKDKGLANISYHIRINENQLFYLGFSELAKQIDLSMDSNIQSLRRSAIVYKPIRDAVAHTSIITDTAKNQLKTEYDNIRARLSSFLEEKGIF